MTRLKRMEIEFMVPDFSTSALQRSVLNGY